MTTELSKAIKYLDAQIEALEKASYMFESVIRPRYEEDVKILKKLREDRLKLAVLKEKKDAGLEISNDEFYASVPEAFR